MTIHDLDAHELIMLRKFAYSTAINHPDHSMHSNPVAAAEKIVQYILTGEEEGVYSYTPETFVPFAHEISHSLGFDVQIRMLGRDEAGRNIDNYFDNLHTTLWSDWDISRPERRELAKGWLLDVMETCGVIDGE